MGTPSIPNKSRKEKDAAYESRTKFHPLTVRVHDNRRKEVEIYAKTKKCPNYERTIKMLNEKINSLEGLIRRNQNEALNEKG